MASTYKILTLIGVLSLGVISIIWGDKLIGKTAVTYLKKNPGALDEVIQAHTAFKEQEQVKANQELISKYQDQLFSTADGSPAFGNPNGTKVFTVFLEPFCGYCRQFKETIDQLAKEMPDLKVIARDIPFLTETSPMVVAALISAQQQGKYVEFQHAIHEIDPQITQDQLVSIAQKIGMDGEKFKSALKSEEVSKIVASNLSLAKALNLNATPMIVTRDNILLGAASIDKLKEILGGTSGQAAEEKK